MVLPVPKRPIPDCPQWLKDKHWHEAGIIAHLIMMRRYSEARSKAKSFLKNDESVLNGLYAVLDDAEAEATRIVRAAKPKGLISREKLDRELIFNASKRRHRR